MSIYREGKREGKERKKERKGKKKEKRGKRKGKIESRGKKVAALIMLIGLGKSPYFFQNGLFLWPNLM